MIKVKGMYDGTNIVLLEPITLSPNTLVEVLIPEQESTYWQQLQESGLVKEISTPPANDQSFTPVQVKGAPISQTIMEERR
jgi:hypothetical protein